MTTARRSSIRTIFLLSPANCSGKRAQLLVAGGGPRDLAVRVQGLPGAPIGEIFTFMSGLYFRGKLAYASIFANPPPGWAGAQVIVPGAGLVPAEAPITLPDIQRIAQVPIDVAERRYRVPLERDAAELAAALRAGDRVVLLGSVATDKYVEPLSKALASQLSFPEAFIGRGDMSRGGLLLRCARNGQPLRYVSALASPRCGLRPPRLADAPVGQEFAP